MSTSCRAYIWALAKDSLTPARSAVEGVGMIPAIWGVLSVVSGIAILWFLFVAPYRIWRKSQRELYGQSAPNIHIPGTSEIKLLPHATDKDAVTAEFVFSVQNIGVRTARQVGIWVGIASLPNPENVAWTGPIQVPVDMQARTRFDLGVRPKAEVLKLEVVRADLLSVNQSILVGGNTIRPETAQGGLGFLLRSNCIDEDGAVIETEHCLRWEIGSSVLYLMEKEWQEKLRAIAQIGRAESIPNSESETHQPTHGESP